MEFEIKDGQDYIELNKLLQIMQIAQTGGHAKILVKTNEVIVNGQTETQVRKKLRQGDVVEVEGERIEII